MSFPRSLFVGLSPVVILLCFVLYKLEQITSKLSLLPGQILVVPSILQSTKSFDREFVASNQSSKSHGRYGLSGWDEYNPLAIPWGQPPNLPSIRVESKLRRGMYGGKGDKKHLGGFIEYDRQGISPRVWTNMITKLGVKSLMDVGCGRGFSTLWFHLHGVEALCVEGSHDAVVQSVLPDPDTLVVEHDFSRGPWWPAKTYDAVWSVEFLEHVGVNYHFNYIATFRKAALIFATSSQWGGWHHVEVHSDEWWIRKYTSYGFIYDPHLTAEVKQWARDEWIEGRKAPNGQRYAPQHISLSMKVFVNPRVVSLPQHAHLLLEHGCHLSTWPCGGDHSKLAWNGSESMHPKSFPPPDIDPTAQKQWETIVKRHISQHNTTIPMHILKRLK